MNNIIDVDTWKEIVRGTEYLDILKAPTSIQTNKEVLLELLRFHPEQFKSNSLFNAVKSDPKFMLDAIEIDPGFIEYVSRELLFDDNFKNEVAYVSKDAAKILKEEQERVEMIDTAFNVGEIAVVATVIASNVGILKFVSDEMKDHYELMSLASKENEIVQDYVALNKEEFGNNGIAAVRDNIETEAKDIGIEQIEERRNDEDERFAKVADKIKEVGKENSRVMRYMTAMLAQGQEIDSKEAKKIIEYAILQMEMADREKDENGNLKTSLEETMKLLPTQLLDKVVEKSGILKEMPELEPKIEEYRKRREEYSKQFKKQKRENRENRKNELSDDTKNVGAKIIESLINSGDSRAAKVADKIKEVGMEDPKVIKYMVSMIATQDEVAPDIANKIYEYAQLQLQTAITESPAKENLQKMIPPILIKKIVEKSGIMSDLPDADKKLSIYERNYQKCRNKQKNIGDFDTIPIKNIVDATLKVASGEGIEQKAEQISRQIRDAQKAINENVAERVN